MTITDPTTKDATVSETSTGGAAPPLLPDELVERCRERAAAYDRANRFFTDDLTDLRDTGYLTCALPPEFGGVGTGLDRIVAAQRRLASAAPPTALALSMHLYFAGGAATLHAAGDPSLDWLLRDIAGGAIVASGHAETGNDLTVLMSTSHAEPVADGYRITGRKRFGSLGPVWTIMGVNALDASDPDDPRIVHAFVRRDDEGVHVHDEWDTLGMRATQSYDTTLDSVYVPEERVARALPPGDPTDPFFGIMSTWAFLQFAAVYLGIADRALELAVNSACSKTSIAMPRSTMAHHPHVQADVAAMYTDIAAAGALLDATVADVVAGTPDPTLPLRVFATKQVAVEHASAVVSRALDVCGGGSIAAGGELQRLYRDVTCGRFNGVNRHVSTEVMGKALLGVDPQPRW